MRPRPALPFAAAGPSGRTLLRIGPTALVAALAIAGCGEDGGDDDAGELTVSAASSLTEAFEAYGERTEIEEKFSFAGSDDLAAQIRQGAPVDVFAAANTSLPEALHEEGLVGEPTNFIANELVLAVPAGSQITKLHQVGESGVDVVVGARGVPVGDYTREAINRIDGSLPGEILDNVRSEEPDVKSIVAKLATGAADAGFVYASDVDAAGDDLVAIELSELIAPDVEYGIAIVSESDNAEAAQEFVDGLLDGAGREALLGAEFLPPEGD
jgi:molybdate transport system substrate-binding protein